MTASIVVSGILLAADQELGVEELAVRAGTDLVDRGRVEIDEDGTRHIFAAAGLGEESLERATLADILGLRVRATISSETVLEEVTELLG